MNTPAQKISKTATTQPKAAQATFFRKAGDAAFFGTQKTTSFFEPAIQPKLTVSKNDDPQEKEANSVAEKVMKMPEVAAIPATAQQEERLQKKEEEIQATPEAPMAEKIQSKDEPRRETLQTKSTATDHFSVKVFASATANVVTNQQIKLSTDLNRSNLQRQSDRGPPSASSSFEQTLHSSKGSGSALPSATQSFMESRFGADFSGVRIHSGTQAAEMSQGIQAQAFAHGNDIYFNSGKYSPDTTDGKALLAHELTHTIQQGHNRNNNISRTPRIQRAAASFAQLGMGGNVDLSKKEGGAALPSEAQEFFFGSYHANVSDIRIHRDFEAAMLCRSKGVKAVAQGRNIAFDPYYYSPDTEDGGQLLSKQVGESLKQRSINVEGLQSQINSALKAETAPPVTKKAGEAVKVEDASKKKKPGDKSKGAKGGNDDKKGAKAKGKKKINRSDGPPVKSVKRNPKKSPSKPDEDPAFQKVVAKTKTTAKNQRHHDEAEHKADDAQKAAPPAAKEAEGKAQKRKTDGMDDAGKKDQPFDEVSFKADLLKKIESITPKTLEEATEFKENNRIGEVKEAMGSKVSEEKKTTTGPVTAATTQPLQVNNADNKKPLPLPPTIKGAIPSGPGAKDAAPKQKLNNEISMEAQSKSLDAEMKANNVTEDQLQKSNEPSFAEAANEKRNAQKDAAQKPAQYRKDEALTLNQSKATANAETSKALVAMNTSRGKNFEGAVQHQQTTKQKDQERRANVAKDIEAKYADAEVKVNKALEEADTESNRIFDAGSEAANREFENYVAAKMSAYKRKRYSGFWGRLRWAKDKLFGMPDAVNAFYVEGRQLYLNKMDLVINQVARVVTNKLNEAKQAIVTGKKAIDDYVNKLPKDLADVGKEAASNIQDKFDSLETAVNDKRDQLIEGLAKKYVDNVKKLDDRITELKEANQGLIDKAIGFLKKVWKVIKDLTNLFTTIFSKLASIIGTILSDPGGFFDNLGKAFDIGFTNFKNNFLGYLEQGLMDWLQTNLGIRGITLPKKFDAAAIFGFALQVMGITKEHIKERAVLLLGARKVAMLEAGGELLSKVYSEGLGALWGMIYEKLTDFKDMVWEAIKSFIKTKIIEAAITFLLSMLNPIGAFIKVCMAIYDFLMMLVRFKDRIIELLDTILNAVTSIASGAIDGAAKAIEAAFAKSIPVIIGFLAALLHLNDIAAKVRDIIMRIRARVDKAIDWVLKKAASLVKSAGGALAGSARKAVGAGGTPQERLENGLLEAQGAVNRVSGKKVGAIVLRPLLGVIKLKYGFQTLDVVPRGNLWAVAGKVNPEKEKITAKEVATNDNPAQLAEGLPRIINNISGSIVKGSNTILFEGGDLQDLAAAHDAIAYVGNVPTIPKKSPETIAKQYLAQGFSNPADAKSRFSLVIGVNTYDDLAGTNAAGLKKSVGWKGFPLGVFGFLWRPQWSDGKTNLSFNDARQLYQQSAPPVKEAITQSENKWAKDQAVIPIGAIRDAIISHDFTKRFTAALQAKFKNVYVHTGDDDAVSLKAEPSEGFKINATTIVTHLFDRYDALLKNAGDDLPVIASGGYRFRIKTPAGYSVEPRTLTTIANDLDMAIRKAMGRINPETVYFPEPNTIIKATGNELTAIFDRGGQEGDRMVKTLLRRRGGQSKTMFDERVAIVTDSARFSIDDGGSGEVTYAKGTLKNLTAAQIRQLFGQVQSHADADIFDKRMKAAYPVTDVNEQSNALSILRKHLFPNEAIGYDPALLREKLPSFNPSNIPFPSNTVKHIAVSEKTTEALQVIRSTATAIKQFLLSIING